MYLCISTCYTSITLVKFSNPPNHTKPITNTSRSRYIYLLYASMAQYLPTYLTLGTYTELKASDASLLPPPTIPFSVSAVVLRHACSENAALGLGRCLHARIASGEDLA